MTWYVQYTVTATAFICMFNIQVHIDKESEGGPSPADPVKLGEPAPQIMARHSGTAVVHGNTAYFSVVWKVYSYTVSVNKWTKLPPCTYQLFSLAIVKDKLTTIGGVIDSDATNSLFSLSGSSWKEVLPPMPTKR